MPLEDSVVEASINVTNCMNITVFMSIYGYSDGLDLNSIHKPEVSIKIYMDQQRKTNSSVVSWGRRLLNDRLLEYRSECS